MGKLVSVKAVGNDHRVILWERAPGHPGGEVFIVNDGSVYQVAETQSIRQAVSDGKLVMVNPEVVEEEPAARKPGRPRKED